MSTHHHVVAIDMNEMTNGHDVDHRRRQQNGKTERPSRSRSSSANRTGGDRRKRTANIDGRAHKRDLESASSDAEPLIHSNDDAEIVPRAKPPIANPELDDDDDVHNDDEPNTPEVHPGVDDGFFGSVPPGDNDDDDDGGKGRRPFEPRIGDDDGAPTVDHGKTPVIVTSRRPSVSHDFPTYNPNVFINEDGVSTLLPDVNVYQHKKTLAQGMMDLALLSANANQLRYVLESYNRHPYYYASLTFISVSIILQVAVGVGLIWNSRYNVKNEADICKADRINNFTVIGIFMITVVNVFISSFGVADAPLDMKG